MDSGHHRYDAHRLYEAGLVEVVGHHEGDPRAQRAVGRIASEPINASDAKNRARWLGSAGSTSNATRRSRSELR